MSRTVLIDSGWYIRKFRQKQDPLLLLADMSESREVATCGMVIAEVGRGFRDERVLGRYRDAWREMLRVDDFPEVWEATLALAWSLDRKGIILPVQDIHIAVCAMQSGAVILTYDQHFQMIPGIDATDRIY